MFFNIPNFDISLGSFIFWSRSDSAIIVICNNNRAHEYGHSIQSLIFGPFYLLVVGLPSIGRVFYGIIFYAITKTRWQNYYSGYPENWATKQTSSFWNSLRACIGSCSQAPEGFYAKMSLIFGVTLLPPCSLTGTWPTSWSCSSEAKGYNKAMRQAIRRFTTMIGEKGQAGKIRCRCHSAGTGKLSACLGYLPEMSA